ncbi:hypothetical protein MUB24_05240 [Lederbergia sp. NSJ-179]|uniref:hypothetical protein n=1 Tax=Lederbergia sp. NSJ-179 TaxID=2931402 RepID=UPI001FD411EE|nr:hypothetical protein [Lederbergia sp. NSJ-179]MCJ7840328.1 hypothetical protein [Lederbergia sp. NSJ-179]
MNMPDEFNHSHHTSRQEVIDHLLESIIHEEMALANLLNAGASKIHAFIGSEFNFPTQPSNQEIIMMNKSALHLLRTAVVKDWFLLNKLEEIFAFDARQMPSQPLSPLDDELDEELNEDSNELQESQSGEEDSAFQEDEEFSDESAPEKLGGQDEPQELSDN